MQRVQLPQRSGAGTPTLESDPESASRSSEVRITPRKSHDHLLVDDARVLSNPADASVLCDHTLDDWTGVDVAARDQVVGSNCCSERPFNLPKTWHHRVMIVLLTPGIAGDPAPLLHIY